MGHNRNVLSVAHELSQRLLRIWIISSAIFGLAVCATSYSAIRSDFEAGRQRDYFDVLAKKLGGRILLPVDCYEARGEKTADYSIDNGHCWYELAKSRTLYPEYADLADVDLSDRVYAKAGIKLTPPQPWKRVVETARLVVGLPLGALAAGWALLWIAAGFRAVSPPTVASFRGVMPRLYELKDRTDSEDPNAYVRNLEESLTSNRSKLEAFLRLERQLSVLDDNAWRDLKERGSTHLHHRVPGRGWQALFDIFNEAKGFAYLQRIGCENVRFIPPASGKTPDLEGFIDGQIVLCEVKTINISKDEAQRRDRIHHGETVGTNVSVTLTDGLLVKFASTLGDAVQQLNSYDLQGQARRIVLAVIHFDDWVGDYQTEYFAQIDDYLLANPIAGAKLVVCPASNLFDRTFRMRNAAVVEV